MAGQGVRHYKFEAVPGIFADLAQNGDKVTTVPGFGLLDRRYDDGDSAAPAEGTPWQRLCRHVKQLNRNSSSTTQYKVLFLTRHGLGYHNAYHYKVGNLAWDSFWSYQEGDGDIFWADAKLNDDGIRQANDLCQFWCDAIARDRVPLPEVIYTSPLARCLETTRLVFERSFAQQGVPFQPIVKELIRERLTDHTCDRRSTRTWIAEYYPDYVIEPGLTETDELWTGRGWETQEAHVARKQKALEDIFGTDTRTFIGLIIHSFAISAILKVIGMRPFQVREGSTIAVLVKAMAEDSRE